jgi:cytidine deaminase
MNVDSDNLLDPLFEAAKAASMRAYVPYSHFQVGAAILSDDGKIYVGCNVENAAYPTGTCAEAGAVSAMICGGGKRIECIVVIGKGDILCTPCGNCRQRIREFARLDAPIHVANENGIQRSFTLEELLPFSFGPENLKK